MHVPIKVFNRIKSRHVELWIELPAPLAITVLTHRTAQFDLPASDERLSHGHTHSLCFFDRLTQ